MFQKVFLMLLQGSKKQPGAELEPQNQNPPEPTPGYCKYAELFAFLLRGECQHPSLESPHVTV